MSLNTLMNWLNDEPDHAPRMQRDGIYGLLGWRDIRHNETLPLVSPQTWCWMVALTISLPMLFVI
jgi:hypothetical protein